MPLISATRVVSDIAVVTVHGSVESGDLAHWTDALEAARMMGRNGIVIDLAGLERWSLPAQAFLLLTTRQLAVTGRKVVLCRPPDELTAISTVLKVFDRVTVYGDPREAELSLRLPAQWWADHDDESNAVVESALSEK